jgi:hypothetical protein
MKKIFVTLFALAVMLPAGAQMTPEAVMGMTPDLPPTSALLDEWKENHDPFAQSWPGAEKIPAFVEAHRVAQQQISDMMGKTLSPSMKRDAMAGKVAGTNKTVQQVAGMSEEEAKALAMSTMKGRLGSLGLSQADLAKMQGGNLSKADEQALASKMFAAQTGGMTMKDIEAMSNMTDEQRAAFMQESGLGESVTAKMNADKGKRAYSQKQYQLVSEMAALAQKENALQQKAIGMIDSARKNGLALFDEKYRKADAAIRDEIAANQIPEKPEPGFDTEAALARLNAANLKWFHNMSAFYAEYILIYRNAVAGAMDCCRAQLLPVKKQRQEIMEKLYALTGSAEYALSAQIPFEASSLYFDLAGEIVDYDLDDELFKE